MQIGGLKIGSLLFADNVVLLALSDHDLQRALGQFEAKFEEIGLTGCMSKSEAVVLCWKRVKVT